jgi:chaperone required for assembly of F1-ATPase
MSASPQRRTWWQGGADWNMEQWGRDELALERHAHRFAELKAAAMVLQNLLPA